MYYEINVSLKGKHFFATHARSLSYRERAEEVLSVMMAKFPKSEGYEVTMTRYETVGYPVTTLANLILE